MPIKLIQINGVPQAANSIATDRPPAVANAGGDSPMVKTAFSWLMIYCRNHWVRGIGLGARRRESSISI